MKSLPSALAAHLQRNATEIAYAIRITRQDGVVLAITSHVNDVIIDGVTYASDPGLDVSSIVTTAGLAVGNMELRAPHTDGVFPLREVLERRWDHAAFEIFRFVWSDPSAGKEVLLAGNFGEITVRETEVVVELRSLAQYLQQPVGSLSSPTCRYRLGDSRCKVNLESFRVTGSITHVTSGQVFRDSSRTEPADWFGEGIITWTSGPNAGLSAKVRSYQSDGTFTLFLPMVSPVQVGHAYSVVPGCRKRLEQDCRDKYDNVLNFGGEPHRPGRNEAMAPNTVGV